METPADRTITPPTWRLVAGFLGGAIVWTVYFWAVYLLSEAACEFGFWQGRFLGLSGLAWVTILLTAVSTAVAVYAAYWSWQAMHREQRRGYKVDAEATFDRIIFMGYGSLALNVLFAVTIFLIGLPALFLAPCGWG